jgi:hypothetical protein
MGSALLDACEGCLLNYYAFSPSSVGTQFCTVAITRNLRNCLYTMTQNHWNHASDWGHGLPLSHSFPFMFAWTGHAGDAPDPHHHQCGTRQMGPAKVHGGQCWTGPAAAAPRMSELRGDIRHLQIQPPTESGSSTSHCLSERWWVSACTCEGQEIPTC